MNKINQYRTMQAETARPYDLVVTLYEALENTLETAHAMMIKGDTKGTNKSVNKSIEIIGVLREGLDKDNGAEIAANLDRLYEFMSANLLKAVANKNPEKIAEVISTLKPIKGAWNEIPTEERSILPSK